MAELSADVMAGGGEANVCGWEPLTSCIPRARFTAIAPCAHLHWLRQRVFGFETLARQAVIFSTGLAAGGRELASCVEMVTRRAERYSQRKKFGVRAVRQIMSANLEICKHGANT